MPAVIGGALDFRGGKARLGRQTSASSSIPASVDAADLVVLGNAGRSAAFSGRPEDGMWSPALRRRRSRSSDSPAADAPMLADIGGVLRLGGDTT